VSAINRYKLFLFTLVIIEVLLVLVVVLALVILGSTVPKAGIAVAQWLRYCATNRKVAGSIPDGVIGIFH
jgi:hypothetical protein